MTETTVATPESEADDAVFVDDDAVLPAGGTSGSSASAASTGQAAPAAPVAQDPAPTPTGRIGEILLASGALDQTQLDAALEGQKSTGDRLGTV
ncbi:MAG: hypothetical protein ACTHN0_15570, partial [Aquihabitans sp.]